MVGRAKLAAATKLTPSPAIRFLGFIIHLLFRRKVDPANIFNVLGQVGV
jgi:hypothetical protein